MAPSMESFLFTHTEQFLSTHNSLMGVCNHLYFSFQYPINGSIKSIYGASMGRIPSISPSNVKIMDPLMGSIQYSHRWPIYWSHQLDQLTGSIILRSIDLASMERIHSHWCIHRWVWIHIRTSPFSPTHTSPFIWFHRWSHQNLHWYWLVRSHLFGPVRVGEWLHQWSHQILPLVLLDCDKPICLDWYKWDNGSFVWSRTSGIMAHSFRLVQVGEWLHWWLPLIRVNRNGSLEWLLMSNYSKIPKKNFTCGAILPPFYIHDIYKCKWSHQVIPLVRVHSFGGKNFACGTIQPGFYTPKKFCLRHNSARILHQRSIHWRMLPLFLNIFPNCNHYLSSSAFTFAFTSPLQSSLESFIASQILPK